MSDVRRKLELLKIGRKFRNCRKERIKDLFLCFAKNTRLKAQNSSKKEDKIQSKLVRKKFLKRKMLPVKEVHLERQEAKLLQKRSTKGL